MHLIYLKCQCSLHILWEAFIFVVEEARQAVFGGFEVLKAAAYTLQIFENNVVMRIHLSRT